MKIFLSPICTSNLMTERALLHKPTLVIGVSLWDSPYGKTGNAIKPMWWVQVGQFYKNSRGIQFRTGVRRYPHKDILFQANQCQPLSFVGNGFWGNWLE